jgi:hypothetical protein
LRSNQYGSPRAGLRKMGMPDEKLLHAVLREIEQRLYALETTAAPADRQKILREIRDLLDQADALEAKT